MFTNTFVTQQAACDLRSPLIPLSSRRTVVELSTPRTEGMTA